MMVSNGALFKRNDKGVWEGRDKRICEEMQLDEMHLLIPVIKNPMKLCCQNRWYHSGAAHCSAILTTYDALFCAIFHASGVAGAGL